MLTLRCGIAARWKADGVCDASVVMKDAFGGVRKLDSSSSTRARGRGGPNMMPCGWDFWRDSNTGVWGSGWGGAIITAEGGGGDGVTGRVTAVDIVRDDTCVFSGGRIIDEDLSGAKRAMGNDEANVAAPYAETRSI